MMMILRALALPVKKLSHAKAVQLATGAAFVPECVVVNSDYRCSRLRSP